MKDLLHRVIEYSEDNDNYVVFRILTTLDSIREGLLLFFMLQAASIAALLIQPILDIRQENENQRFRKALAVSRKRLAEESRKSH